VVHLFKSTCQSIDSLHQLQHDWTNPSGPKPGPLPTAPVECLGHVPNARFTRGSASPATAFERFQGMSKDGVGLFEAIGLKGLTSMSNRPCTLRIAQHQHCNRVRPESPWGRQERTRSAANWSNPVCTLDRSRHSCRAPAWQHPRQLAVHRAPSARHPEGRRRNGSSTIAALSPLAIHGSSRGRFSHSPGRTTMRDACQPALPRFPKVHQLDTVVHSPMPHHLSQCSSPRSPPRDITGSSGSTPAHDGTGSLHAHRHARAVTASCPDSLYRQRCVGMPFPSALPQPSTPNGIHDLPIR
jgi:hypothetical protein